MQKLAPYSVFPAQAHNEKIASPLQCSFCIGCNLSPSRKTWVQAHEFCDAAGMHAAGHIVLYR
eukprot:1159015-Pelagomonas_calceolata.AAC.5